MRSRAGVIAIVALLGGCGSSDDAPPAEPSAEATVAAPVPAPTATAAPEADLAACPRAQSIDLELRERKKPIPLPPVFDGLAKTGMDHFAVLTLDGGTVCVDTSWFEQVSSARVMRDSRFLSFEWVGYEAFGYVVVDRNGKGTVIETGNAPLTSPDGNRLASVDLSVSGFGGLNALAVWQVAPTGLRPLAKVEEGIPAGDWTLRGWSGNTCVNLGFLPIETQIDSPEEFETHPRDPWHAAEARRWKPAPGSCPGT